MHAWEMATQSFYNLAVMACRECGRRMWQDDAVCQKRTKLLSAQSTCSCTIAHFWCCTYF